VRENSAEALIVLDRWCYLGTARSEVEIAEIGEKRPRPVFDLDTYKILSRFFASPRRDYQVVELAA
jgi:DNA polymerase-3 subunit epsilon